MPTLFELLTQLESAVRADDRVRALELAQQIQQQLVRDQHAQAAVERRVRGLLAELDRPATRVLAFDTGSPHIERGIAPLAEDGVVYPVWFGTNRQPTPQGDGFTGQRHDRITRGRVEVYVPEAHRFGETGSSFWQKLKRFDLRDDTLRVQHVARQERDPFFAEIRNVLQSARESGDAPHALFFLHGFNVSFEEAAIRAAQIGFDLKVPGATAFFSWPSRGNVAAYPADEASIEASERAITDFLIDFTANCGAEKVHVIAHSMGNRGLLRAL